MVSDRLVDKFAGSTEAINVQIIISWTRKDPGLLGRLRPKIHHRMVDHPPPSVSTLAEVEAGLAAVKRLQPVASDWVQTFAAAARMAASADTGYSCGLARLTAAHPKSKRSIRTHGMAVSAAGAN